MNEECQKNLTANYDAVKDYFGQDYSIIVPALVKAWDDASTIEMKDNICQSEIIQQVSTGTTLSVFYRLSFPKIKITVLKIFVSELYDKTGNQDAITIVDDALFIVGIEPVNDPIKPDKPVIKEAGFMCDVEHCLYNNGSSACMTDQEHTFIQSVKGIPTCISYKSALHGNWINKSSNMEVL